MNRLLTAFALTALPLTAAAQSMTPAKLREQPSTPATARIAYGSLPQQMGDLRLPPGKGPFPVAVVVHGGCWRSKTDNLLGTSALASALTAKGFATWNIEYRRLGDDGGGWPGTFQDWAAGADHLRALAKTYPLDLKRVIVVGHSAGGHAAQWLGSRGTLPKDSALGGGDPVRPKLVVNLDGPPALKPFAGGRDQRVCGEPVIIQLMGGTPAEQAQRYRLGDPSERLPHKVPQLLVASAVLLKADAEQYAAAARAAGDKVEILDVTGSGHFDMIAPTTPTWPKVEAAILARAPK